MLLIIVLPPERHKVTLMVCDVTTCLRVTELKTLKAMQCIHASYTAVKQVSSSSKLGWV